MRPTDLLLATPLPGVVLWGLLYCSDYWLTITCARLYRDGAHRKLAFEGSYEITPYYQRDVDRLRKVSARFVGALVASTGWLVLMWWLSARTEWPSLYAFGLGALLLLESVTHVRHVRNLTLFRAFVRDDAVTGRLEYPRSLLLRLSTIEFVAFGGLFALAFMFSGSWFVLGGAAACAALASKHALASRGDPRPV